MRCSGAVKLPQLLDDQMGDSDKVSGGKTQLYIMLLPYLYLSLYAIYISLQATYHKEHIRK